MGVTYCENSDLVLDNGTSLDTYLDVDLTEEQKTTQKNKARERAYNFINDTYLIGKSVIPASHIPGLKQIEVDLVIVDLMTDSFSMETANTSEWTEKYKDRADKALDNLRFDSSSGTATADSENTGDGTVSAIVTNKDFTRTERWILRAMSATQFSAHGSLHGYIANITVGTKYPEKDWTSAVKDYGLTTGRDIRFEEFPIALTITAGAIAFVQDDKFTFNTYCASYFRNYSGQLIRA